jgi:hypothetical protein
MEKDLRTANGPIRHLEFLRNFNKSFRIFKALKQQLAQKVYKCVNMFFSPHRVSVVDEIKPLDNKSPHNITSLNIDRWIDL